MKNIKVSFDSDDIKAVSCALSVLPAYDFFDFLPPKLIAITQTTIFKLHQRKNLDQQALHLIAIAVDSANKALRGEITVDPDAISELRPYLFTINKLASVFAPVFDEEQ